MRDPRSFSRRARSVEEQIVTIDTDSAPRILFYGENFLLEDLPIGTRVIYPRRPLAGFELLTTVTAGLSGCVVLQVVQVGGFVPPPPVAATVLPTVPVAFALTVAV